MKSLGIKESDYYGEGLPEAVNTKDGKKKPTKLKYPRFELAGEQVDIADIPAEIGKSFKAEIVFKVTGVEINENYPKRQTLEVLKISDVSTSEDDTEEGKEDTTEDTTNLRKDKHSTKKTTIKDLNLI
jgi:hypothetical protein